MLNSDKWNEYLHKDKHICKTTLRRILFRKMNICEGICRKIKKRFFKYFFVKDDVVYEIMLKNMVQTDRQTTHDNIIRRMRFAC